MLFGESDVREFFGCFRVYLEWVFWCSQVGFVIGMYYMLVGGDIMFVEVLLMLGKGGFQLIGQFGDVMQELVCVVFIYVWFYVEVLCIDLLKFVESDVYIYVLVGVIFKDGLSVGIMMVIVLVLVFLG